MTLQPAGALWPRPGEVLELLGLDGRVDLANLVRTDVEFMFDRVADVSSAHSEGVSPSTDEQDADETPATRSEPGNGASRGDEDRRRE